jgi:chitinase
MCAAPVVCDSIVGRPGGAALALALVAGCVGQIDGSAPGAPDHGGGPPGPAPTALVFSAYKDTSIDLDWNSNVVTTKVSGPPTPIGDDLVAAGGKAITLAFAVGECGSESWGGVQGPAMAQANAQRLADAGVSYILSTGGAAGTFTCGSDAGFAAFLDRWASDALIGVDFDIEAGQTPAVIGDLIARIEVAHQAHPTLRFSLTLATLADNDGAATAQSLGAGAPDSLNPLGDATMAAVTSTFGFTGDAATWPAYVTVDLMTMDYGAASRSVCVVKGGACDMSQSAIQAAHNLHDHWGVPYANIELTPMIGGNDAVSEQFTPADADAVTAFAIAHQLAGVHYWSYDRDTDCPPGAASPTCNTLGGVGTHGFLKRFLAAGMP